MIEIDGLYKSFGSKDVLKNINLDLSDNNITAIVGPNGSGKTTLIKCILGMVLPDKGEIRASGSSIHKEWKYREQIGYLPQIARFPENLQVKELLDMVKGLRNTATGDGPLIHLFELEEFMDTKISKLSGGTLQKINLIIALMYDCPVLILDEPSNGLDPIAMIELKKIIHERKKAGKKIIFTTHIMNLVEVLADEIIFLMDGDIYFKGPVSELMEMYDREDLESAIACILKEPKKGSND